MKVRKIIEREVEHCVDCPLYSPWHDMGMTHPMCSQIKSKNFVDDHLDDIHPHKKSGISKKCPFKGQDFVEVVV